ncbi:hypothetical protein T08_8224 [Trichinella sp. T8]|nr:hypothetical protein T08_8224 [Trichinella sp. T8]
MNTTCSTCDTSETQLTANQTDPTPTTLQSSLVTRVSRPEICSSSNKMRRTNCGAPVIVKVTLSIKISE